MVAGAARLPGFALIEVIVAMTVLASAALGVAGMMTWAAAQIRRAESDEALVSAAESSLDSLLAVASPADGERHPGTGSIQWSVETSRDRLTVQLRLRFTGQPRARDVVRELHVRVTRVYPPPIVAAP